MEFGLLMTDIPIYISCIFEIYIFKIAIVISENVRIAFLCVLSILFKRLQSIDMTPCVISFLVQHILLVTTVVSRHFQYENSFS